MIDSDEFDDYAHDAKVLVVAKVSSDVDPIFSRIKTMI